MILMTQSRSCTITVCNSLELIADFNPCLQSGPRTITLDAVHPDNKSSPSNVARRGRAMFAGVTIALSQMLILLFAVENIDPHSEGVLL